MGANIESKTFLINVHSIHHVNWTDQVSVVEQEMERRQSAGLKEFIDILL